MKRFFTLIELIVVIVVLGILAIIVIPNISNMKDKAETAEENTNKKNIQTAVDLYTMVNGTAPTFDKPEIGDPQIITLYDLHPEQLRNLPREDGLKYQIDHTGRVFTSFADSPSNVEVNEYTGEVTWDKPEKADSYNIYKVNRMKTTSSNKGEIVFVKNTSNEYYNGDKYTEYIISSIDSLGNETAPVGENHNDQYALGFDGVDNFIEFPDTKKEILDKELTVEAEVKFDKIDHIHNIVSKTFKSAPETTFWLDVRTEKDKLTGERETRIYFGGYDEEGEPAYTYAPYDFELNKWYNITATDDGFTYAIYVNGEKIHTDNHPPRRILPEAIIKIGKRGEDTHNFYFNGKISTVKVWDIAKSEQEVKDSISNETTGQEYGLVGYWKLNEGFGTKVNDSSKNGYQGVIKRAVWTSKK